MSNYIPLRPHGDDEEALGLQALWDRQYDPKESIFISQQGSPVRFEKRADGKYLVHATNRKKTSATNAELFYPFKIYLSPNNPDSTALEAAEIGWRTVRVRAGVVLPAEDAADATDNHNNSPDDSTVPAYSDDIDVVVPADTAQFYFWLELNDDLGVVRYGTDPTATSYASAEQPESDWVTTQEWSTFPEPDGLHLRIGDVNTLANATAKSLRVSDIRQYLREDVQSLCGL